MVAADDLKIDAEAVCANIVRFIRAKVEELGREGVILGLSGGIDSCVVAYLSARAVGPGKVTCLILPEKHSSARNVEHAKAVAEILGTNIRLEDLTSKLNSFGLYRIVPGRIPGPLVRQVRKIFQAHSFDEGRSSLLVLLSKSKSRLAKKVNAFYQIKHRVRMVTLYYHADQKNLLVAGALNKTEFLIGLFIPYGCDHAADIMPIRHLYKTQVRQLAEYLGVPREIIDKPPSPDMIPGIDDEDVIGMPYELLDLILFGLDRGLPYDQLAAYCRCKRWLVEQVVMLKERSSFQREPPAAPEV